MKKLRALLKGRGRKVWFVVFASTLSLVVLLTRLSSLAPSLSPAEQTTLQSSVSLRAIYHDPLHLPLKLLQWLAQHLPLGHQVFTSRLPSVCLALLALATFTYILHRWYGPRTTVFGFVLFVLSAWFLHTSRFAGTEIEYLTATLALLAIHVSLYDHDNRPLALYLWTLVNGVLLFIPGFIWFVLLGIIWQHKELLTAWRNIRRVEQRVGLIVLALLCLAAPIYSIVRSPDLLRVWLGAPDHVASWRQIISQFLDTLGAFVYHGPHNPELWLGQLPLLDLFTIVSLLAGVVFYARHWRAMRTRLLLSYFVLGVILVSLGGAVRLSSLVALVYLVAVAGVAYMLHFWLQRFPRNPLARSVGIVVVAVTVGFACLYNAEQYFIAWPHNPDTAKVYTPPSPQ